MRKIKLLLDANLSPETAIFLRSLGFEVASLIEEGQGELDDEAVAHIAKKERRILITFDLDFGEVYYFSLKKQFNVLILRLHDQRVETVNEVLKEFLKNNANLFSKKEKHLVIISEHRIRIAD